MDSLLGQQGLDGLFENVCHEILHAKNIRHDKDLSVPLRSGPSWQWSLTTGKDFLYSLVALCLLHTKQASFTHVVKYGVLADESSGS